ncbi:MAG: penicillin-binding transpeptidase domain-containing protein [Firmicutes bacterium]|nr:penicillin-binding transpeptidase domain-containing protein [Bacillota bacterium]
MKKHTPKYTQYNQKKRLLALLIVIVFLFVAVLSRILYIEVFDSGRLQSLALDQWMRDVPLTAERGEIFDRNGVLLADSMTVYTLYARPIAVKNKELTASILADTLNLDYKSLLEKINSRRSEVTIAKNVNKDEMFKILHAGATGVYFSQNIKRVYPYGDFMTQILGFTNTDSDGQTGIERQYNQYLKGKNGYILTETDLIGRELKGGVTRYIQGTKGNDIHLTMDYYIQSFAESAVSEAFLNHNAKAVSLMVIDVTNGAVVAMAQKPSFDLNQVPRDNIAKLFAESKSTLVTDVFEPGSTFKILTTAIGLETGAVSRKTGVYCRGHHIVDGQRIKCWRTIGHGSLTFDEGVMNSCNVLFMNTALAVGANAFYSYIDKFGLTRKTGIDISGEASGLTIPLASVKTVDLARIGFGQAIAVTPIELLVACASVINGGNLVTPHLLSKVTDRKGRIIHKSNPKITKGIISNQTSLAVREILERVVAEGSGRHAGVEGYRIGGKTGTAQKYENGAIARGKYTSTFIGFAPADNPKYMALIVVDEPQGAYYGSMVCAPYVGGMFSKIFAYEGMRSATIEEKEIFEMPDIVGMGITEAMMLLRSKKLYVEVDGEGGAKVINQIPAPRTKITSSTVCLIGLGN